MVLEPGSTVRGADGEEMPMPTLPALRDMLEPLTDQRPTLVPSIFEEVMVELAIFAEVIEALVIELRVTAFAAILSLVTAPALILSLVTALAAILSLVKAPLAILSLVTAFVASMEAVTPPLVTVSAIFAVDVGGFKDGKLARHGARVCVNPECILMVGEADNILPVHVALGVGMLGLDGDVG